MSIDQAALAEAYHRDGFVSPVPLLRAGDARAQRSALESVEAAYGSLHYISKIHTVVDFAADLATDESVLDAVEALLGPDILLFDAAYIVKEPKRPSPASWHQDLTCQGFSSDEQVSMWLALSPATKASGCLRMLPGSHLDGQVEENAPGRAVSEDRAVLCPLAPGEESFHHGWTLHESMPNRSDDRLIGLSVQYIAPSVSQRVNRRDTAVLVRGEDRFGHYGRDVLATGVMDDAAVARHAELGARGRQDWA